MASTRSRSLLLGAACLAARVHAQFTMQSYNGLIGAVDLGDEFGPEDKLQVCYNQTTTRTTPLLVYPDLDGTGTLFVSADMGKTWATSPITSYACPDPGQPSSPLAPRDAGYTMGVTVDNTTGFDRLVILGGDGDATNNVYYSDDCGLSWNCYDGEQIWDPRDFAPMWRNPWVSGDTGVVSWP